MKIKSENTAKTEIIFVSLLMVLKTVFTQPLYNKLPILGYSGAYSVSEILSAVGAVLVSVVFSAVLISLSKKIGENATPLVILAVAEPLLIATVSSLFHAVAAMITVIWVAFCLNSKNKIASAAVSVVSAAVISFLMPNSIFSYVVLGIIVLLISLWSESKLIATVSAAVSAAVSALLAGVIDIETRMELKLSSLFYICGGNECNPLNFDNLFYEQKISDLFSRFADTFVASLPVVAAIIFVAVALFGYKSDYTDGKKTSDKLKTEKILTVIAIVVPYVFAAFASTVCTGNGGVMGFNIVPLVIVFAFVLKGNKAVTYATGRLWEFAKSHPVISVISLIWLAANTTSFAAETKLFDFTTLFAM